MTENDALPASEQAIRDSYRVVSEPSWRVEKLYGTEWRVVSYCGSEDAAKRSLERNVASAIKWGGMTQDERMASILRDDGRKCPTCDGSMHHTRLKGYRCTRCD